MNQSEIALSLAVRALLFFKQHATNPAEAFICQQALVALQDAFTCLGDIEL